MSEITKITITEALSEIKLMDKKAQKKAEFIVRYLVQLELAKDPLTEHGGSRNVIAQERQAMDDLLERKIVIRRFINDVNAKTKIKIGDQKRSIAEWLIWKRDVAPHKESFLRQLSNSIQRTREKALQEGRNIIQGESKKPEDVHIHLDEKELAEQLEEMDVILETLDGQLSLKNATTFIEF